MARFREVNGLSLVAGVCLLALAAVVGPTWAADDSKSAASDKSAAVKKERADPRGPLPAYYRNVIDGLQREKMYKIYDDYEPKVDELRDQLKALIAKRDAEISALLTPEQRQRVNELAAEAKAKRDAAGDKKPEAPAAAAK